MITQMSNKIVLEKFINAYLDFNYGVACVIGLIIFCGYLFFVRKSKKSQGQNISKKEIFCGLALSIYVAVLLGGTLLNRNVGEEYLIEWVPFWSYYQVFTVDDSPLAWQMVYNVLVFIPMGILLPVNFPKVSKLRDVVICSVGLSLIIEVVQLVSKLGLFEFDDLFHNTLGAMIGYGVWRVWRKCWKNGRVKRVKE